LIFLLLFLSATPIYFEGKSVFYSRDGNFVVLKDSVKVLKDKTSLFADSLIYFLDDEKMKAFGRSVLIFDSDTLKGDSLYYDTKTKNGFGFTGKMNTEKGFFQGLKIAKDSTDTVYVEKGSFTTCDLEEPHYCFRSLESKVILKDMAIVKPVILEIHGLPVFAVPFWIFPLSKERKSGFLVPRFGVNSTDGKYIRNLSYYLVLNNYADATFTLELYEKRGVRGLLEFVFRRYRFGSFNLNYSLAEEWNPWRRRWSLSGFSELGPFAGFRLTGRWDYYSDNELLNDYADVKENWLKRELTSFLGFSKTFGKWVFSGSIDDRLNLQTGLRSTRVPALQLGIPSLRFGNLGVSSNWSFLREYSKNKDGDTVRWGTKLSSNFSYSLRLAKYLRFNFSIYATCGLVDRDTSGNRHNVFVKNVSGNAGFSTVLYGRTLWGVGKIDYFTHTFQPTIGLFYQPEIHNPPTNFYFVQGARTKVLSMNLSLNNNFGVMVSGKNINIVTLSITSSQNLLDTTNTPKFNVWNLSLSSLGLLPFSVRLTSTYYRDAHQFNNPQLNLSWNLSLPLPRVNFTDTLLKNVLSLY